MKKVFILLLALVWCHAVSAQKVTFRLNAAATYAHIPDFAEELLLETSLPPGTPFYSIPTYQEVSYHTRFKEKAGAKLGGSVGVHITQQFSIETGLQANLVRFRKQNALTFPDAGAGANTSDPVDRRWRDPGDNDDTDTPSRALFYGKSIEPDPKEGNTAIVYIDVPVKFRYQLYKLIDLKVGFTTSQLVYAERYMPTVSYSSESSLTPPPNLRGTDPYDPTWQPAETQASYTKYKSGNSFNKSLFSFTTGITLKATEHIGLDLDYARYLTPIYTSQAEKHPHKYNLFSLGMSYAF